MNIDLLSLVHEHEYNKLSSVLPYNYYVKFLLNCHLLLSYGSEPKQMGHIFSTRMSKISLEGSE